MSQTAALGLSGHVYTQEVKNNNNENHFEALQLESNYTVVLQLGEVDDLIDNNFVYFACKQWPK